jgi:hypothetical protein
LLSLFFACFFFVCGIFLGEEICDGRRRSLWGLELSRGDRYGGLDAEGDYSIQASVGRRGHQIASEQAEVW